VYRPSSQALRTWPFYKVPDFLLLRDQNTVTLPASRAVAIPGARRDRRWGRYRPFYVFRRAPVCISGFVIVLLRNALGPAFAENRTENRAENRLHEGFLVTFEFRLNENSHERAGWHENTGLEDKHTSTLSYSQKIDATPQRKTARLCGKIVFFLSGKGFVGKI
jgi:hypothetical protein